MSPAALLPLLAPLRLLVLSGPNLGRLGTRQPEIYGRETLADIHARVVAAAEARGVSVEVAQSDDEGELVRRIGDAPGRGVHGVVLNAGWASGPVTMAEVEAGAIANPTSGAPAVVAWFRLIGLDKGDVLELEVVGPGGGTLVTSRLRPLDDDKDEYLALVGEKSARPWPAGSDAADLRVMRGGKVALTRRIALTL